MPREWMLKWTMRNSTPLLEMIIGYDQYKPNASIVALIFTTKCVLASVNI